MNEELPVGAKLRLPRSAQLTVRLVAIGSGANRPTVFNNAKSFAASTFTTVMPKRYLVILNYLRLGSDKVRFVQRLMAA